MPVGATLQQLYVERYYTYNVVVANEILKLKHAASPIHNFRLTYYNLEQDR